MRTEASRLEPAPIHLGRRVLAWASAHPEDPAVPEALHRVVRASRFGCRPAGNDAPDFGEVSRAAFERLHRRYPRSPWTEKTPYWFR